MKSRPKGDNEGCADRPSWSLASRSSSTDQGGGKRPRYAVRSPFRSPFLPQFISRCGGARPGRGRTASRRGFLHARWHCELNRDVVFDGIPPYMGIKSTAGELYMRVQIDENSVTLTPFGSLIRINPANATDEHKSCATDEYKSWLEILRTALSHHREKRSDEMPVRD
jgi:hypothetical protein